MGGKGRPPKENWPECKRSGCERSARGGAFGLCRTHYMAYRRGRIDKEGIDLRPRRRVVSYAPGAICLVPECGRSPIGLGLCSKHLQRHKKGENVGVRVPCGGGGKVARSYVGVMCKVPGCPNRPVNKWMCDKHTQQRDAGIIDGDGNPLRELMHPGRRPLGWRKELTGYLLVRAPEGHPHARRDGSIYEHRLVMEDHLGRYLHPEEVVHHLNGDRADNRVANLQLRRSRKEHGHGHERIEDVEGALVILEQLINKGVSGGPDIKKRLQRLARRLPR